MDIKKCNRCGETKSLNQYYRMSGSKDGYANRCKYCENEYQRSYRKTTRRNNKKLPELQKRPEIIGLNRPEVNGGKPLLVKYTERPWI